jgi:adenylate cyclase
METEIERKFLVPAEFPAGKSSQISQSDLCCASERTIRVRIEDSLGTLTIKGKAVGFSRPEFEHAIPLQDPEELIKLALTTPATKVRPRVALGRATWEADFFRDANEGLVVAEIELEHETPPVAIPDWVGEGVPEDRRYQNSRLAKAPFRSWHLAS